MLRAALVVFALGLLAARGRALGASSTPIEVAPDGSAVWVVNPDSNSVAKLDPAGNTLAGEFSVGRYPRTVAVASSHVYVTNQRDDTVTRLDTDGSNPYTVPLGLGCAPYGVVATPDGGRIYVSCEGSSALVVLDGDLSVLRVIVLSSPEARALALGAGGSVFVTHFITKEPNNDGHVSEVDPVAGAVKRVLSIPPDFATCETLGSGQGVANLLSAVAVVPSGAQLWVGGTLHDVLRKGLFERSAFFKNKPGVGLFPDLDFQSNPAGEGDAARRNIYRAARHDIARAQIWKIDLASGNVAGKIDLGGGGQVAGIAFSPTGDAAHVVDLMANGYYVFNTARGQGANASGVFEQVSAGGPGGANPAAPCTGAVDALTSEGPFILSPQARLVPTGGMEPLDATTHMPVDTGLEFTVGTGAMRGVPDGVGTTPAGVVLSPDGTRAYVANYLARNVAVVGATPAGFVCQGAPGTACATRLDCPDHAECMPLVQAVVSSTTMDLLPAEILDGKILFSIAARDANGAGGPVPPWNQLLHDGSRHQGEVTSTARDGESLACTTCHGDFGGNDGRTWDFSQFSSSLRNTMDLRGRASFVPGTCSNDDTVHCTTDADCDPGHCVNDPAFIPPNILPADAPNFFNPMGSTHWNGDRDEVEDFEFTYRELLGASDCDGAEEKPETCVGALVVRRFVADPVDARADLGQPNRNRSVRLNHMADFVYSLKDFVRNPNLLGDGTPSDAARRGRLLFNDPVVHCSFCHNSSAAAAQQFTNKGPNSGYDVSQTPRADLNSPFVRFDVGTANVFDETNPFEIANDTHSLLHFTLFQNEQVPIPGNRSTLNAYLTPVMNDVWNTAPYLHDGSAPTLLSVVRPCNATLEDCNVLGKGRNVTDQHGVTSFLSARQLNDLVAFELAPHGPVGEARAVSNVVMNTVKLVARFGRRAGTDRVMLQGRAALLPDQLLDPAHEPVTVSLGVPAGERMAIVERTIPVGAFKANGAGTSFRFVDRRGTRADGVRKLLMKIRGKQLAFRLAVARTDLAVLRVRDPDLTVALEVGGHTIATTRRFHTNKKGTVTNGPETPRRTKKQNT